MKERLLELSEMDDRRRGLLRETRGLVGQWVSGELSVDSGSHHVLGDASNPRDGWRNLLTIWKRDQARVGVPAVAWRSATSTSSCESGSEPSTIRHDRIWFARPPMRRTSSC